VLVGRSRVFSSASRGGGRRVLIWWLLRPLGFPAGRGGEGGSLETRLVLPPAWRPVLFVELLWLCQVCADFHGGGGGCCGSRLGDVQFCSEGAFRIMEQMWDLANSTAIRQGLGHTRV
jgi:hypothetical protein